MDVQMERNSCEAAVQDDGPVCWICLEGANGANGALCTPCKCPRTVHLKCLSRWCLHNAGKREERTCRFCSATLPDWKTALAPLPAPEHNALLQNSEPEPVMVVTLGDQIHRVRVMPGEQGRREFQAEIKRLFQIPDDVQFEVTFRCKVPTVEDSVQLEGMTSYEAATHCAALMAAQRQAAEAAMQQQQQQQEIDASLYSSTAQQPVLLAPDQEVDMLPQQQPLHEQQQQQPLSMAHLHHQMQQQQSLHSYSSPSSHPSTPTSVSRFLFEPCPTPVPHHLSPQLSATPLSAQQHLPGTPWPSGQQGLPSSNLEAGYVEATATPTGTSLRCGLDAAATDLPAPFGQQQGLRRSARLRAAQALLGH